MPGVLESVNRVMLGRGAPAAPQDKPVRPSRRAIVVSVALIVAAVILALVPSHGDGFAPRVATVDALAGLVIAAFLIDRLLTFVKPLGAAPNPAAQRTADVAYLRVGYGLLLGGAFVFATDLRAVEALTAGGGLPTGTPLETVGPGWDRLIATFAIGAGVAGLARLVSGLNPQPETEKDDNGDGGTPAVPIVPPPTGRAYAVGLVGLGIGALIALSATGDKTGLDLLGSEGSSNGVVAGGGSVAVVVRFGTVLLLAGIIEQVVERIISPLVLTKENKPLVTGAAAVILGVGAARVVDLFLLHNIGFFDIDDTKKLNDALAASSDLERWFDTFATGLVIAAGTKPLHDLSARLRKRTKTVAAATTTTTTRTTLVTPPGRP